jgi:Ca2+-binding RTX toxin-like protein
VVISQLNVDEPGIGPIGGNLVVQGSDSTDVVYVWTNHRGQVFAWLNGMQSGPHVLGEGGRAIVYADDGNDRVFATDSAAPVTIYGEGGHDLITGGSADDVIDGGEGVDRIDGRAGDDLVIGGPGGDVLDGNEGNDILLGGAGDDYLMGRAGNDILIGGTGTDRLDGGAGEDLLIGGVTSYDSNLDALMAIHREWSGAASFAQRVMNLQSGLASGESLLLGATVHDDGELDCLIGAADADWLFASPLDILYGVLPDDEVSM